MSKVKYGDYIKELCCDDCEYAGQYKQDGWCPLEPVSICPDCGGELSEHIGRWRYSETPERWWKHFPFVYFTGVKTTYHGFEKGRKVAEGCRAVPRT